MSTRHAPALGFIGTSLARCAAVALSLKSAWERRRVVGQLGALDDHMLRDIGITRQDVLSVLAEPLFSDPSVRLAERASEARSASRALAHDARTAGLSPESALTVPGFDPHTRRAA